MLVPHDESVVQSIVHQMSLSQFGTTPPSVCAAHVDQGEVVLVEQGSPTAPWLPAQMEIVDDPDWIGWQSVPEKPRQSAFVTQPGKQMYWLALS